MKRIQRRKFLATGASILSVSVAGCITENRDVVQSYERGYELYNTAEELESENDLEERLNLYKRSVEFFEGARLAAETETVERYCYESRELARVKAGEIERELEEAESEAQDDDSDGRYETYDSSEYVEYIERVSVAGYEMRSPSTVARRTRVPF